VTNETGKDAETQVKGFTDSLRDLIERTFLAGMGAAALTKDRIQELVEEFVNRGQMNSEEGREVVERLVARSREEARSVLKKADSSLHGAYRELGLTSKRDLEDLSLRIAQLEHRVQLLEGGATGDPGSEAAENSSK
jgi:polyhydroxyalkanoate synthesis regulator phasin